MNSISCYRTRICADYCGRRLFVVIPHSAAFDGNYCEVINCDVDHVAYGTSCEVNDSAPSRRELELYSRSIIPGISAPPSYKPAYTFIVCLPFIYTHILLVVRMPQRHLESLL